MASFEIQKGATANIPFATRAADRTLVNADSTPTITGAQLSGDPIATTGFTIVQQQTAVPANITGRYYIRIPNTVTAGWADRATGQVQISAVIGGVTCTEEVNFVTYALTSSSPFIDVN